MPSDLAVEGGTVDRTAGPELTGAVPSPVGCDGEPVMVGTPARAPVEGMVPHTVGTKKGEAGDKEMSFTT